MATRQLSDQRMPTCLDLSLNEKIGGIIQQKGQLKRPPKVFTTLSTTSWLANASTLPWICRGPPTTTPVCVASASSCRPDDLLVRLSKSITQSFPRQKKDRVLRRPLRHLRHALFTMRQRCRRVCTSRSSSTLSFDTRMPLACYTLASLPWMRRARNWLARMW